MVSDNWFIQGNFQVNGNRIRDKQEDKQWPQLQQRKYPF
jgi:hypothetical protein